MAAAANVVAFVLAVGLAASSASASEGRLFFRSGGGQEFDASILSAEALGDGSNQRVTIRFDAKMGQSSTAEWVVTCDETNAQVLSPNDDTFRIDPDGTPAAQERFSHELWRAVCRPGPAPDEPGAEPRTAAFDGVPSAVADAASSYIETCRGFGSEPTPSSRFIAEVELNTDGVADYVIDTGELQASCFCGSGGCAIEVWVSEREGYIKAYESNVRRWDLSQKSPSIFIVDLHGTACGGVGADLCLKALVYRDGKLTDTTASQ